VRSLSCDARRAENFGREVSSERQDLSGIAVVDLEHSGSAFGFDSQLSPHRARPPLVDSLRVVIRDHEVLGVRVNHLDCQCQPFRLEVVSFIDQDSVVLSQRNVALVDSFDDCANARPQSLVVIWKLCLGWLGNVIGPKHAITPRMECADLHSILYATFLHRILEAARDAVCKAEHQDGLRCCTGQILGAKGEYQSFARSRYSTQDAMPITEAASDLLLVHIHNGKQCIAICGRRWIVNR